MTEQAISPDGPTHGSAVTRILLSRAPRGRRAKVLGLLGGLGLVLLVAVAALAVHDEGFQLEGNAEAADLTFVDIDDTCPGNPVCTVLVPGTLSGVFAGPFDWDSIFDNTGPDGTGELAAALPAGFIDGDFVVDFKYSGTTFVTSDDTTFATGSKDTLDITPGWQCNQDNNVNSKTDIVNAYATLFEDGDDRILYFGLEKDVDNGTNNVGLWLMQDPDVECSSTGGAVPFTGNHVAGDIFLVSAFTNGGGVANITAYQWTDDLDGDGTADDPGLDPDPFAISGDCLDAAAAGADDRLCAVVNGETITMPWRTADSSVINAAKVSPNFFEGGINLAEFPEFADSCFTGFMLTTRSSQSLTATLFDYALGNIDTCNPELALDKEPEDQSHNVGTSFDWTLEVTNSGDGPADDAVVTDTIPDGLTINSATVDPVGAGTCDVTGQDIECTVDVDAGDSITITVNVTSTLDVFGDSDDGCIEVTNTGTVAVDGDTDPANNSDTVVATICRPLVEKTAAGSFTHDVQWDIEKSVDIDQHTQNAGEDADSTYTVTVTKTVQDSGFSVTGTITIENPSLEDPMTVDVTDALSSGESLVATAIDCPGVDDGDDLVIPAATTVECSYTIAPADSDAGTNTATVTLNAIDFTADAAYTFTATNTGDPETINVTDVFDGDGGTALGSASVTTTFATYTHNFACSTDETLYTNGHYEYTKNNTATIDETGEDDSESVDVDCYIPTISKTAEGDFNHGVDWTIEKDVDIDQHTMLAGEDADSTYTVTVTKEVSDTDFAVTGSITIANPNPEDDMTVDVTDLLSSGEAAAAGDIDCGAAGDGDDLVVPNGESVVCTYELNPADADAGTNTATATFSADANVSVSDDAAYTFTATNTGDPETINVTDVFDGDGGTALGSASVTTTFATYTHNFACSTDETLYTNGHYEYTKNNTATIDETGDNDSESVDVDCYIPTITKSADGSFDRDWDWTIEKVGSATNLILAPGQSFIVDYDVTVTPTKTDSEFEVAGSITVGNPSPEDAMTVDVTDELSSGESLAAGDIDCGAAGDGDDAVIAAGDSIVCTYDFTDLAGVVAGEDGTNTATATLSAEVAVTDTDGYTFGLDAETDECITVTDPLGGGELGVVCADDDPADFHFEYTFDVVQTECGEHEVPNTASFETSDQDGEGDDTGSDDWNVVISIPCEEGCTLTQGYWKTHSSFGPAPEDEVWMDLPDVDGDGTQEGPNETFFLSGQTWYQVFWTAPKGNAYYILAKQYMAAVLNGVNGASTTVVDDELAAAKVLFETYTPAQIEQLKGKKPPRPQFISLAGTLASYNEGDIGPGHCDEDRLSSTTL